MRAHRPNPAFALIEVVLALAITSILLLSMMSLMRLVAVAAPSKDDAAATSLQRRAFLDRLRDDTLHASSIQELSANVLRITVPDRNGDSTPESLHYEFKPALSAITLSTNAATPIVVLNDVSATAWAALTASRTHPGASTNTWQPATVLLRGGTLTPSAVEITTSKVIAQTINPVLPPDATAWRIERAELWFRKQAAAIPSVDASIRTLDANGRPSSTILQTQNIQLTGSTLQFLYAKFDVTFDSPARLSPGTPIALHLIATNGATALGPVNDVAPLNDSTLLTYDGSSWTEDSSKTLSLSIWIAVERPQATTTSQTIVQRIDFDMNHQGQRVSTSSPLPNLPEAP